MSSTMKLYLPDTVEILETVFERWPKSKYLAEFDRFARFEDSFVELLCSAASYLSTESTTFGIHYLKCRPCNQLDCKFF
jgi:hypothetical protein